MTNDTPAQQTTVSPATFTGWWGAFNAALIARGLPEATLEKARLHSWWGRSPASAAEWEALANG